MAVEAVALVLLSVLVVGLLRSHAEILRRLHELGAGLDPTADTADSAGVGPRPVQMGPPSPRTTGVGAPELVGVTPNDEAVALSPAAAGRDTLLAFLTTGCTSCMPFWEWIAESPATPTGGRVVVVTRGPGDESVGSARNLSRGGRVDVVMSSEAWEAYGVPGAPYFVQVDGRTGKVSGEGTAKTWDQVQQLLTRAATDDDVRADDGPAGPWTSDAEREVRIDRELENAGILPGDPRLFHQPNGQ